MICVSIFFKLKKIFPQAFEGSWEYLPKCFDLATIHKVFIPQTKGPVLIASNADASLILIANKAEFLQRPMEVIKSESKGFDEIEEPHTCEFLQIFFPRQLGSIFIMKKLMFEKILPDQRLSNAAINIQNRIFKSSVIVGKRELRDTPNIKELRAVFQPDVFVNRVDHA